MRSSGHDIITSSHYMWIYKYTSWHHVTTSSYRHSTMVIITSAHHIWEPFWIHLGCIWDPFKRHLATIWCDCRNPWKGTSRIGWKCRDIDMPSSNKYAFLWGENADVTLVLCVFEGTSNLDCIFTIAYLRARTNETKRFLGWSKHPNLRYIYIYILWSNVSCILACRRTW